MASRRKSAAEIAAETHAVVQQKNLLLWIGALNPRVSADQTKLARVERAFVGREASAKSVILALLRAGYGCVGATDRSASALRVLISNSLVLSGVTAMRVTEVQAEQLVVAMRKGRGRNATNDFRSKHLALATVISEIVGEPVAEASIATYLKEVQ